MPLNHVSHALEKWWRKYIAFLGVWTALVFGSLAWSIQQEQNATLRTVSAAALANINKDIGFRKWANSHGGVYVPPTEHTPPNPYLKVPDRDVVTTTGKSLTLMNPAYVLREMQNDFAGDYGFNSHITSLKLLNSNNAPDAWEADALRGFEHGEKERLEIHQIDGEPYLRLMRPFFVDSGCLKCHADQGYKVGDIRGGISASVPMKQYLADGRAVSNNMTLSHGVIWLIGLAGLGMLYRNERLNLNERKQEDEKLERYKDQLEEEVRIRTANLILARDAAEAANKAKSVFLTSINHELRTPLNAILGFSSLLRQDTQLLPEQRNYLDIVNRSGEHLLTLINDVLDMAKIESGKAQLTIAPFDFGAMVRDVVDMMHVRAQEKGLQLLIEQSSEFPRYVNSDEAHLRQVLINLLGNAIKFTRQGGITLRFGIKPHDAYHLLVIEIEDSGIGISAEDQQHLFQPFIQMGEQAGDNKGTGLGLAITRKFVQLMGGTIRVESTPGKGSLFQVELPVSEVGASEIPGLGHSDQAEIAGLAPDQPVYRILIVEDQLENQLLLRQLMQRIGFEVNLADEGKQGVQLFKSWHPHLIWMDRRMPVMDGVEATQIIRQLPGGKDVKIVAVTASTLSEERDEMLASGMDDFVRKPYRFNEIYECLTRQLGVQYIYAKEEGENESPPVALTAEMLAVLPQDIRKELHDALESLDGERIEAVVVKIADYDATLHRTLIRLIESFEYPPILEALGRMG